MMLLIWPFLMMILKKIFDKKKIMRLLLISFFSLLITFSWGQSSVEKEDFDLHKELSFGINFNTNAGFLGGFGVRYAIPQNNNFFHLVSAEIVNVKHKKEAQFASAITSSSFIPEKLNYLFSLRTSYGREYVLFQKYPEAGVRVTGIFAGGPTFGLLKPYYVEYQYSFDDIRIEAYNPIKHNLGNIRGNGSFLYGLNQLKILPGFHLKTGLFFELSQGKGNVSGVEFGMSMEGFLKPVPIYNIEQNKTIYSAVYIVLHYGTQK